MSTMKISPYLMFNGNAAQAIQLYELALGAVTATILRYGDVPGMDVPAEKKGRVMHAELTIGESTVFASDGEASDSTAGGNVEVCINFDDAVDAAARFAALSAGGTVRVPLQDTFWGKFGMLTDVHGVRWMFNVGPAKK
jgi:PhnB protein